jgi:hypothetical protein
MLGTHGLRDISVSLAYVSTSGREVAVSTSGREVAALASLFPTQVSKLYKRTKWPVWLQIIASLRSARWSDFCKQKEWVGARFIAGQWVFKAWVFSDERKRLYGATNFKMADRHWMMIQRNRGRPRASRSDEICVTVEGLIREGRGVTVRENHYKITCAILNIPWKGKLLWRNV